MSDIAASGVYLRLFHGRPALDTEMDDWGEAGPVFGPYPYFHTTYGDEIKFDEIECNTLSIVAGMVRYNGMFYGDWSIFGLSELRDDHFVPEAFDPQKA